MIQSKIINGKSISEEIIEEVRIEIIEICQKFRIDAPKLGILMVGENPASKTYVKNKIKSCDKAGIRHQLICLDNKTSEEEVLYQIDKWNKDSNLNGYIVQLPLPESIDRDKIIESIDPSKDVDGFHPLNFGKTALGLDSLKPATPWGILKLIKHSKIETKGKHVVIVGRSNIVGKPLAIMLGNDFNVGRSTVTSCDINTPRELLIDELLRADIIITAMGVPNFLKSHMIKQGVIIIDVGINKLGDGIVGDVDFSDVLSKCSRITPVPGGVGPMTVSALICNILTTWKNQNNIKIKIFSHE